MTPAVQPLITASIEDDADLMGLVPMSIEEESRSIGDDAGVFLDGTAFRPACSMPLRLSPSLVALFTAALPNGGLPGLP